MILSVKWGCTNSLTLATQFSECGEPRNKTANPNFMGEDCSSEHIATGIAISHGQVAISVQILNMAPLCLVAVPLCSLYGRKLLQ